VIIVIHNFETTLTSTFLFIVMSSNTDCNNDDSYDDSVVDKNYIPEVKYSKLLKIGIRPNLCLLF
jgi:hypothetical protein